MPSEYDWVVSVAFPDSPILNVLFMFWLGILVLRFVRFVGSLLMLPGY